MNRIGVLTAGGDTPALNATLHGVVARANELRIEVFGLLKGYHSLLTNPVPYLRLNPLFQPIPELDPTYGGSILGSSRAYVDSSDQNVVDGNIITENVKGSLIKTHDKSIAVVIGVSDLIIIKENDALWLGVVGSSRKSSIAQVISLE